MPGVGAAGGAGLGNGIMIVRKIDAQATSSPGSNPSDLKGASRRPEGKTWRGVHARQLSDLKGDDTRRNSPSVIPRLGQRRRLYPKLPSGFPGAGSVD